MFPRFDPRLHQLCKGVESTEIAEHARSATGSLIHRARS